MTRSISTDPLPRLRTPLSAHARLWPARPLPCTERLPARRPPRVRPAFSAPRLVPSLTGSHLPGTRSGELFAFAQGSQHMCRYSTIRALLEAGDVELI